MDKNRSIYVAGHNGLVGRSVVRKLKKDGYKKIILKSHKELDLLDQTAVFNFFKYEKPDYVIDCAARVGGVGANVSFPSEFLYENIQIQNNLMWAAKSTSVAKFLFIGSSTVYSDSSPQPIKEESLMLGPPEKQNEAYALSKIMGIKLCEYIHKQHNLNFISCTPTNIYGELGQFDASTSNVIPSLIHRMHSAKINNEKEVLVWGSGKARREFLYADDLSDALVWLMDNYNDPHFVNIGTGSDISIKELAEKIKKLTNYKGNLMFDTSKPDGVLQRKLDVSRLSRAGWQAKTTVDVGLERTYKWYLSTL